MSRVLTNARVNSRLADCYAYTKWLPWAGGEIKGATMPPQSCRVWRGIELVGCARSGDHKIVNARPRHP